MIDQLDDAQKADLLRRYEEQVRAQCHCPLDPDDDGDWDAADFDVAGQVLRGRFPVRVPLSFEIYIAGNELCMRKNEPGQPPVGPFRKIVNVLYPFDRMSIRDRLVKVVAARRKMGDVAPSSLHYLALTHRESFLATAVEHFAKILDNCYEELAGSRDFAVLLVQLHEHDADLIVDLVCRTMAIDRVAGRRLRDVMLERIDEPRVRNEIGWLEAATLVERLETI